MKVGDVVRLKTANFEHPERYRVVSILGATQLARGPLLLTLESAVNGRRIYDYPSSQVTKEEQ